MHSGHWYGKLKSKNETMDAVQKMFWTPVDLEQILSDVTWRLQRKVNLDKKYITNNKKLSKTVESPQITWSKKMKLSKINVLLLNFAMDMV